MSQANPRFHAETVRPGGVDAGQHDAIKPYIPQLSGVRRLAGGLLTPALRAVYNGALSPTEPLGKFLVEVAMGKWDGKLEGPGVRTVGPSHIVNNAAFRRLAGI